MSDFDEMLRMRNMRYLTDTFTMICTLGDRLTEGLRFQEYRERLERVLSGEATPEQREELLSELQAVYAREAARLQQRLDVMRYLSQEVKERLEQPDFKAATLPTGELLGMEELPSLPHPSDNWMRASDLPSQLEARSEDM